MFAIVGSRAGEPQWRRTYVTREVRVGSDGTNQLVLAGALPWHARVIEKDGRLVAVDLVPRAEPHGVLLNGKRMRAPTVIREQDRLAIGDYTLAAFAVAPEELGVLQLLDPVERELVDAVATGDDASRLVYADWLEGRGDHARAELLRLQHAVAAMSPDDPGTEAYVDRMREVAAVTDYTWRSRIAARSIEGCPAFDFACPKAWSALQPTAQEGVRHCGSCEKTVHYCASVEEARAHAGDGRCVALDITSPRWQDDLAAPYGFYKCEACDIDVGSALPHCPRCGAAIEARTMKRGMLMVRR